MIKTLKYFFDIKFLNLKAVVAFITVFLSSSVSHAIVFDEGGWKLKILSESKMFIMSKGMSMGQAKDLALVIKNNTFDENNKLDPDSVYIRFYMVDDIKIFRVFISINTYKEMTVSKYNLQKKKIYRKLSLDKSSKFSIKEFIADVEKYNKYISFLLESNDQFLEYLHKAYAIQNSYYPGDFQITKSEMENLYSIKWKCYLKDLSKEEHFYEQSTEIEKINIEKWLF